MVNLYCFEDSIDELVKRNKSIDKEELKDAVDLWLEGELDSLLLSLEHGMLPKYGIQGYLYERFNLR